MEDKDQTLAIDLKTSQDAATGSIVRQGGPHG